ncbi:MAG: hypothetical protein GQ580_06220 [Candidatus Thorarchaeota archaeon]|nr:hypothetical protein [Candidatus Thorarchaeota archaeon]
MQVDEFFDLFTSYNEMYLVVIILTYVLAIIALFMAYRKNDYSNRFISLTLTFLWLWIGLVYGILVFGPVPTVMAGIEYPGTWYLFGGVFVIHGIILLYFGVIKDTVSYTWKPDSRHYIGLLLILYGLVFYPLVGIFTGRVFLEYPIFGIAPCPVTLFTLGLLLWSDVRPSLPLMIIPIFWGFMGVVPVLFYEVYADIGTVLAAIITLYHYVKWPAA